MQRSDMFSSVMSTTNQDGVLGSENKKIIEVNSLSGFYGNYSSDAFDSISEIVKLWRAVISQGLSDIRSKSKRPEMKDMKNKIYHMIKDKRSEKHISNICNMARLSPNIVRNEFKKILNIN